MTKLLYFLGMVIFLIAIFLAVSWLVMLAGNYLIDYFEVSIKHLNYRVTLVMIFFFGALTKGLDFASSSKK